MMSGGTAPPRGPGPTGARYPARASLRSPRCSLGVLDRARAVVVEGAGDHHPLDLVGALEDLHHLGLAHVALDREVAGVAVAAEDLDRVGGDLHGVVGGDQ